jgi:ParB family transcriptional regulator, chromosome partitioning protein
VKHKGLGKGLGALIPERVAGPENHIQAIPLGQIKSGYHQPRHQFDTEKIRELAESVRQNGIVQPVILRPVASGFELIAGERRWRAAKLAGLTHIPAIIRKVDDRKALELSLIENLQRDDLNPVETARGYNILMNEYGLTQEAVSQIVGKNRATIANMVRLLKLPGSVLAMIERETISTGHAKVLLSLNDHNMIVAYAEKTHTQGWSVRELERRLQMLRKPVKKKEIFIGQDPDLDAAVDVLRKKFSTKIRCVPKKSGGGKIVFEYYDDDDLIRLLALMKT